MKCSRKGCRKTIPPANRKYCSAECRKLESRSRVASLRSKDTGVPRTDRLRHQKPRTCLVCNETFMSSGPWNRFCPECKQKANAANRPRSVRMPRHIINLGIETNDW